MTDASLPPAGPQKGSTVPLVAGIAVALLLCCCLTIAGILAVRWLWLNGDRLLGVTLIPGLLA